MTGLILDHLWQSTLFAALAGLFTLMLRSNGARIRYYLWFAASVKFLIPFAALTAAGSYLLASLMPPVSAPGIFLLKPMALPFSAETLTFSGASAAGGTLAQIVIPILLAIWGVGCATILARWLMRWSQLRRVLHQATDCLIAAPVPVKIAPSKLEPGLVGIWRPVILLPQGINERLSPAELDAILAHEICHLRRRDNLMAATHMLVEALFWFHPLIWWLGARLNAEREHACDESVLASGQAPQVYAESILKVCQIYLQSPLDCAAGISGADLKTRMETIMENKFSLRLNVAKRLLLAGAATIAIAAPIAASLLASPPLLAQPAPTSAAKTPNPAEEAALRRVLEGIHAGNPPYDIMTPASADVLRAQWSGASQISKDMGALTSLTFQMTQGDFHIYAAVYEHGHANWIVGPLANGKMDKVIIDSIRILGTPRPGTQIAARRYIEAMQKGHPNYDEMTPAMASDERKTAVQISALLKSWGALKSLSYEGGTLMGPAGGRKTSRFAPPESLDMYKVEFDNRSTELVIELAPDGKMVTCLIRNA